MEKKKNVGKAVGVGLALLAIVAIARITGLTEYISLDNLNRLRDWIHGFGVVAPIVFVAVYAIAVMALLPVSPLTFLAGLAFGAVWGALCAWTGAMLGATLAFLVGRYAARGLVESWIANSERVRKLDEGVEKHGWRMLFITRLVPVFPFSLQSYAYGLTKIGLGTYMLLTAICKVPGAIMLAFAGSSLATAQENLTKTFLYLGVAAVLFVLISLIPSWAKRRSEADRKSQ
jgi:uncharacterized membrane protein YdjX (TVP38/TMEM64 family)